MRGLHKLLYICFLPIMFPILDPPRDLTITPPAITVVGAVFTCLSESAAPPVDRYEWKYRLRPDGNEVHLGNGNAWAVTADVIYGN